jgi:hypothetical protein
MVRTIIEARERRKAGAMAPAFSPFHARGWGPTPGAPAPPSQSATTLRRHYPNLNHFVCLKWVIPGGRSD